MRIAIVHDYLTQRGGAERVVLHLTRLFPGAPVFTSLYEADGTFPEFAGVDIRTSRLQGRVDAEAFRREFYRFAGAFRELDLSDFDTVIVSSSAFAHHVQHPRAFVYCYTPPRFLWEPGAYFRGPARLAARTVVTPLRWQDRRAAARAHAYVGISRTSAQRIAAAYGMEVGHINPPLETGHLPVEAEPLPAALRALVVSRLLPYKRVDVAIDACAALGLPLTVVGHGPQGDALRQRARGHDVEFLSNVPDADMPDLYRQASVVLVPGVEDFGYVPVEANFAGRPVVAIGMGGPSETVVDGQNGRLVATHDTAAWAAAVDEVLRIPWDADDLRAQTLPYRVETFRSAVRSWVGVDTPAPVAAGTVPDVSHAL